MSRVKLERDLYFIELRVTNKYLYNSWTHSHAKEDWVVLSKAKSFDEAAICKASWEPMFKNKEVIRIRKA